MTNHRKTPRFGLARTGTIIILACLMAATLTGISGCAIAPIHYGPQDTINGYDPTLRSHREALDTHSYRGEE